MKSNNRGFDCDRNAKNDFTASTYSYYSYNTGITFFESTSASTLVPFGDDRAWVSSRMDLYIQWDTPYYHIIFPTEIKERDFPSDKDFIMKEGAYINPEKIEVVKEEINKGNIPLWAEVYTDKIRVWNLTKIDLDTLQVKYVPIKRYDIYNGPKVMQKRFLLPVSAATAEYRRIKG